MSNKSKGIFYGIVSFILAAGLLVGGIAIGRNVNISVKQPEEQTKIKTETRILSFDDIEKRTSISSYEQVWEENGIVFTNLKADGTSINEEYYNPVRLYKRSIVVVECAEMTEIVFYCADTNYASNLKATIEGVSGITVRIIGSGIVVTFDKPDDSFAIYDLAGIVYLNKIEVTTTALSGSAALQIALPQS